jgi:hypothetical protein
MKKIVLCTLLFIGSYLFFAPHEASAQCSGYFYAISIVGYNDQATPRYIFGYEATGLDYYLAICFDPEIQGFLDETCIINGEGDLDYDEDIGFANWIPAQVELYSTQYHPDTTYTSLGEHLIRHWFYGTRYYLGYTFVCIRTPAIGCGTMNENGEAIPCPTPTPTPSPTPTPPTVNVTDVGFTGDHTMRLYSTYGSIDDPDGSTPTWVRGGINNPVAYTKGTNPTVFAKFTITPTPARSINALLRIKVGGNVITPAQNVPVTLSGNTVSVSGVTLNGSGLGNSMVKKGTYSFDWEVSLDNGQNWKPAGTSEAHLVYWTFAAPKGVDCNESDPMDIKNCTFVNVWGRTGFKYLFDLALEKALVALPSNAQTSDAIAKALAAQVDGYLIYNPAGVATGEPDTHHPLIMYENPLFRGLAQCSAQANLLRGLLRSIGLDAQTIYFWGGKPRNPVNLDEGGTVYVYPYRSVQGLLPETFKTQRPRSSETLPGFPRVTVDANPHFTFHAMVQIDGKYYDPSYGQDIPQGFTNVVFEEVVDLGNGPNSPAFKYGQATIPYIVRAWNMNSFCIPGPGSPCSSNTVITNTPCNHRGVQTPSRRRVASFDDDQITDVAVWRPSDGVWYIQNSFDQTISYLQLGQNSDQIVPGDYDGDGITDIAVFRPSNSVWYILQSQSQTYLTVQWGIATDKPVYGDFDGDGKTDIAVYRPDNSGSVWYVNQSSNGQLLAIAFGLYDDKPVFGDFDGDGKSDIAVFRPSNGTWHWLRSLDGGYSVTQFGLNGDMPVTGDYDGDQKTDVAVFRPSTGEWHLLRSTDGYFVIQLGVNGDVPVPGDYDGDDKTDTAVWSPSNGRWLILNSSDGTLTNVYWGGQINGDIPIPSAFNY